MRDAMRVKTTIPYFVERAWLSVFLANHCSFFAVAFFFLMSRGEAAAVAFLPSVNWLT